MGTCSNIFIKDIRYIRNAVISLKQVYFLSKPRCFHGMALVTSKLFFNVYVCTIFVLCGLWLAPLMLMNEFGEKAHCHLMTCPLAWVGACVGGVGGGGFHLDANVEGS